MAWGISAEQADFEEATTQFRQRVAYTHDQIGQLDDRARAKAFWIAGAVELDAVQAVHDEIVKALERGTALEDFKKVVREKLGARLGAGGNRLELVLRNATQTAYNNARWYQMHAPDVARFRPFLMYDAILDSRVTVICKRLNGTIKPIDDEFWLTRLPPLHHACRSSLRNLRRSEAERRGLTGGTPDVQPAQGFGLAPPKQGDGIPKPDALKHDPGVWAIYKAREAQMQRELEEAQRKAREEHKKQDPAHWLETEYREKYGEDAGRAVAWGRAMEERGRATSIGEAKRQDAILVDQIGITLSRDAVPLFRRLSSAAEDGFISKNLKTLGEIIDALEIASAKTISLKGTLAEAKSLAALVGQRGSVKAAGDAVKIPLPRVPKDAPEELRKGAVGVLVKLRKFWSELGDASLVLPDRRKGFAIQWRPTRAAFGAAERVVYTRWSQDERGRLTYDGSSTIVHEMGHGVEYFNERAKRAAHAFLERRTHGETARKLSDLTSNDSYEDYELAKEDEFFDAYVGKEYVSPNGKRYASELSSMALEYLHRDASKLLRDDPEMFYFALGQLAGESVQ